ncbi:MAG: DsbA family oxidoreductase [Bacillaceae bacterium]
MRVDVWSDYVCPFCYIGKRHLEQALLQIPKGKEVEVVFHSFQLSPDSPKDVNKSMAEVLAEKYGMSIEQAKQNMAGIAAQAKRVGLDYHFDTMIPTNTNDAHRLSHFAKQSGKEKVLTEALLKAYFTDSLHIGDTETLVKLAMEVELDEEKVRNVLNSTSFQEEVEDDQAVAGEIGVKGVPFFVFNNKYALSGAQPIETFVEVLTKVIEESKTTFQMVNSQENERGCTDDTCTF